MRRVLLSLSRVWMWRGIRGSSRGWLYLGMAAGALRLLGRIVRDQPKLVYRERLDPGHSLVIRHLPREGQ